MRYWCISPEVILGQNVTLARFIHLHACTIGDNTKIGAFVEIQKKTTIGKNCKISSHTSICERVTIQDNVFVGHGVTFIDDAYPHVTTSDGCRETETHRTVESIVVERGAFIGPGSTILSNVTIGANAVVGAGSVVAHDVPPNANVVGNPAKAVKHTNLRDGDQDSLNAEITHGGIIQLKEITQQAVRQLESGLIARALEANGWNRRSTARALSISYSALLQKMQAAGLPSKRFKRSGETGAALNSPDAGEVAPQDTGQMSSVPSSPPSQLSRTLLPGSKVLV
jgi:acetyltransferase-like isoleucine patch superfamily enzyme